LGKTRAALVAAVVVTVSVAVPTEVPLMLTGLVEPKLKVGKCRAPAGLDVITAVSAMLPVKPFVGVRVMVEVLPLAAPAVIETALPLTVKPGDSTTLIEVNPS
jgi:hypothetical protein